MGQLDIIIAVWAVILMPMAVALLRRKPSSPLAFERFLTNRGGNGYLATFAGAVCGNVGIGTFLALFIFAKTSPVIGFSIAGAYTLGLLLCAVLARKIHAAGQRFGTAGIIDLIWKTHGAPPMRYIWLPIAIVFIVRSSVQLSALGLLLASNSNLSGPLALVLSALILSLYLLIGGYRASVETDIFQSAIILIVMAVVAFNIQTFPSNRLDFFDLGPYEPALLVGIWLLLPFSAVLAVDNWQRITLAEDSSIATRSYCFAALALGCIYVAIAMVGFKSGDDEDLFAGFTAVLPQGAEWMATALFVASIMSSIDTFVMPLLTALQSKMNSLRQIRLAIVAVMVVTTATAMAFADLLTNIIAAFNSLTVFLPAAAGALFLQKVPARAAILSMNGGLFAAIAITSININAAAVSGFVVASIVYGCALWIDWRKPIPHEDG